MEPSTGSTRPAIFATALALLALTACTRAPATAPVPTTTPVPNTCQIVTYLTGEFCGRERRSDGIKTNKSDNAGHNRHGRGELSGTKFQASFDELGGEGRSTTWEASP